MSSPPWNLDRFRSRLRLALVVRGVLRALGVTLLALVAAAAADAVWHIESANLRGLLLLLSLAAGCATLLVRVAQPLAAPWDDVAVALLVERLDPDCRDRLAPAVAQATALPTHPQWLERPPAVGVRWERVARAALLPMVIALLTGVWGLLAPDQFALAATRQWLPYSETSWPAATELALLDADLKSLVDGTVVPAREPLTVYVANRRGDLPRDLHLRGRAESGEEFVIELTHTHSAEAAAQDRALAIATLTPTAGVTALAATGGDQREAVWISVVAVEPPRLERFDFEIVPPAYSGLPTVRETRSVGHVAGLIGSRVNIRATANAPLQSAIIHRAHAPSQPATLSGDGLTLTTDIVIEHEGREAYRIEIQDEHGPRLSHTQTYELRGKRDAPPVITLTAPPPFQSVTPNAVLARSGRISDDLGLNRVTWMVQGGGTESGVRREPLFPSESPGGELARVSSLTIDSPWDLSELHLTPGETVQYWLEAADACQPSPHFARTEEQSLRIVSPEDKLQEIHDFHGGLARLVTRLRDRHIVGRQRLRDVWTYWNSTGALPPDAATTLQSLDDERRSMLGDLVDPRTGVPAQTARIRHELSVNRLRDLSISERMDRLDALSDMLSSRLLPELADRLNAAVTSEDPAGLLADLKDAQTAVGSVLDGMLAELSDWSHSVDGLESLQAILATQQAIHDRTEQFAAVTISQDLDQLDERARAELALLTDHQQELAEQTSTLSAATEAPEVESLPADDDDPASRERSAFQAISADMRLSAGHLSANRIGESLEQQASIIESLQSLLQAARNEPSATAAETLDFIEAALRQIESLYRQQDQLRRRLDEARQQVTVPGRADLLESLGEDQSRLSGIAQGLTADLHRRALSSPAITASRAVDRSREAEEALGSRQWDSAAERQQEVLHELTQLASELQRAGQELEATAAAERLAALLGRVADFVTAGEAHRTEAQDLLNLYVEQGRWGRGDLRRLGRLAENQTATAAQVRAAIDGAAHWPIVAAALTQANQLMTVAAERLQQREVDAATLAAMESALDFLRGILAAAESQAAPSTTGESSPQGSQSSATTDPLLPLQLRLLRDLQALLAARTDVLRSAPDSPETARQRAELIEAQRQLAGQAELLLQPVLNPAGDTSSNSATPASPEN